MKLKAPFPWFGGKSRCADVVWRAFGDVPNYVEPFAGSLATLLGRPGGAGKIETANDVDGGICNFWRAVASDPAAVAKYCNQPVNELDLHARHAWLVKRLGEMREQLRADPDYYDAKVAGWWVWGICSWIGSGWCVSDSPGQRLPSIAGGRGINAINRPNILEWFSLLQERMRNVKVCCGDWSRVLGPTTIGRSKASGRRPCAIFLDPPYDTDLRARGLYREDGDNLSRSVREWAIEQGNDLDLRICLAGFDNEHEMPSHWRCYAWKARGGYGNRSGSKNVSRERLWFSPHCLELESQDDLFKASVTGGK